MATLKPNALFYDSDCPFCSRYSELMQARNKLGQFAIISLRDDQASAQEFRALGLDLEQGFVFRYNGVIYHGADAMHVLATATRQQDPWLRLNHAIFGKRTLTKWLYPVLRFGRWLALLLLKGPNRAKL